MSAPASNTNNHVDADTEMDPPFVDTVVAILPTGSDSPTGPTDCTNPVDFPLSPTLAALVAEPLALSRVADNSADLMAALNQSFVANQVALETVEAPEIRVRSPSDSSKASSRMSISPPPTFAELAPTDGALGTDGRLLIDTSGTEPSMTTSVSLLVSLKKLKRLSQTNYHDF
jgi:hypothetical protein